MRSPVCLVLGLLLASAGAACSDDGPASPAAASETETRAAAGSAAAGDALCQEHGVLEAVCTQCNPKLIPVFEAKGDWCDEHGFPESFCPICHPDRGGKPASDVSADKAPADGTLIRFKTKRTGAQAGIQTVTATERPGGARIEAVATVAYDGTRYAEVNARASGVIKRIAVDVGSQVEIGDLLAAVESAAVGADRSRVRAATSRVQVAETTYEREQALHEKGISPEKDVLEARRALDEARADLAAAQGALGMVGAGEAGGAGAYTLRAPLAGTVVRRKATIGHMVQTDEVLFEIVDTSSMWIDIDIPEKHLARVAPGQELTLVLDALPEREWTGRLQYLAPEVDPRTRTARARFSLANPEGVLRANMYGRASIALGAAQPTVMVPAEAVQRAGGAALVFVEKAEDLYETRRVKLGSDDGTMVEITEGVRPGEPVATVGSFLLKTETLQGSIGAGCCEVQE